MSLSPSRCVVTLRFLYRRSEVAQRSGNRSPACAAVDARPFKGLCMGGFRAIPPRNFSDFPGYSGMTAATTAILLELDPFVFVQ